MKILRAEASCPYCNSAKEIWFSKGVEIFPSTLCFACDKEYESKYFVTRILDLHSNNSASALLY